MNKKDAILCVRVSRLAYGGDIKVNNFQLTANFENKSTDTQGLFGVAYENTLVIAFRGSEETGVSDWITDLKFVQQVFPYAESGNKKVKVHYGFIEAYKSVREVVLNHAKESSLERILCTGHSLGGALAILAALDIQYNLPDKDISCYTFGAPKVGNNHFVTSYNKRVPKTFRFVNGADVVPNLPLGTYEHSGKLHHIGQGSADWTDVVAKAEAHLPNNYIKVVQDLA